MVALVVACVTGLLFSLFVTPYAIRLYGRLGWAQVIRQDGPASHQVKRGTPTIGGLIFIVGTLIGYGAGHLAAPRTPVSASGLLTLGAMVGFGVIGFLDDYLKIKKQNSGGLSERYKIIGQVVLAIGFGLAALLIRSPNGTTPALPGIGLAGATVIDLATWGLVIGIGLTLVWYVVLSILVTNAVNIVDGQDGLLPGVALTTLGAYVIITLFQTRQSCLIATGPGCYDVSYPLDLAIVAGGLAASLAGYLWWSTPPAKIFMGDTGSLAVGGVVLALMILTRTELLLPIIGPVYVMVAGSVFLQRYYFKLTKGKRIFKMAPIHHHFELSGWQETTITFRFWIISGVGAVIGVAVFYLAWVAASGYSVTG